ncbi:serine hydrolase domain-containing protein [Nocardia salmonicida]|uniref:serine hydrolase domain-containing protein n=1 Tax=Nocardia salmonicida TaxID=53431 RepID=UPI002E2B401C|nr:serine hydrolase domain-containing protein [Nocardia salmonicida]
MRYAMTAVALALVLVVSGCGAEPDTLQRDVDAITALGTTGVQARVVDVAAGTDRSRVAGQSDVITSEQVSPVGHFRIGSLTKTLVATVVLMLVGEGRLTLDDTVQQWVPDTVHGNGNDGAGITVRQLLQHTSGIHENAPEMATADDYYRLRYQVRDPRETVASAMRHPPEFAPGTGWSYSNVGYVLLGMIIERAVDRPWYDEVRARILEPLGLRDTHWPGDTAGLPTPHARGYQQFEVDGPLIDVTELVDADASAGYLSTTADVGTFYRSLLGGKLLRPEELAQMRKTAPVDGVIEQVWPGAGYGLGLFSVPLSCGGTYWMHNGGQTGFLTNVGVTEDGNRSAVVSLSATLAVGEDVPHSKGFAQLRAAEELVDHALCENRGGSGAER